jgi:hypothetical protein
MTSFFFTNKENAKYFLTILGDELFEKIHGTSNTTGTGGGGSITNHTYLCSDALSPLLEILSYQFSRYVKHKIHTIFKNNIQLSNTLSTSTHQQNDYALSESGNSDLGGGVGGGAGVSGTVTPGPHQTVGQPSQIGAFSLANIRILNCRSDIPDQEFWEEHVRNKILDIISVAFHYSLRFENAENFLETYCSLPSVYNSVRSLSEYSFAELTLRFFGGEFKEAGMTAFQQLPALGSSAHQQITNTDLAYLWKSFISHFGVNDSLMLRPAIKLINELMTPEIAGALSGRLRLVRGFREFVTSTMSTYSDDDEYNHKYTYQDVYAYELDELLKVFKMWSQLNHTELVGDINREIGTDQILKILLHYYGAVVRVVDNKTAYGWKCSMWDKPAIVIEYLASDGREHKYTDFCKFLKERQITLIPSKAYYDKFAES